MHSIYIKYTSHNHKQVMKSGCSSRDHYFWFNETNVCSFRSAIVNEQHAQDGRSTEYRFIPHTSCLVELLT